MAIQHAKFGAVPVEVMAGPAQVQQVQSMVRTWNQYCLGVEGVRRILMHMARRVAAPSELFVILCFSTAMFWPMAVLPKHLRKGLAPAVVSG